MAPVGGKVSSTQYVDPTFTRFRPTEVDVEWATASPLATHLHIPPQRRNSGLQESLRELKGIPDLATVHLSGHEPTHASCMRLGRQQTHISAWQTRARSPDPLPD
jgi:hypothetical protein